MQFYLQASIVEKGVTVRQYRASRWDVIVGCFFAAVVAWFIIVACAATLHTAGRHRHRERRRRGAGAAAAGRRVRVPAVRGRTVQRVAVRGVDSADLDGVRGLRRAGVRVGARQEVSRSAGVLLALHAADRRRRRRAAGSAVSRSPTSWCCRRSSTASLLPFVLIFMLLLTNDRELMGTHVNSRGFNVVAWITVVVDDRADAGDVRHAVGEARSRFLERRRLSRAIDEPALWSLAVLLNAARVPGRAVRESDSRCRSIGFAFNQAIDFARRACRAETPDRRRVRSVRC